MTDEEFGEWGRAENKHRAVEMEAVKSADDLKRVQAACATRRKKIGFSIGEAFFAVLVGQRLDRGESLSVAMRR